MVRPERDPLLAEVEDRRPAVGGSRPPPGVPAARRAPPRSIHRLSGQGAAATASARARTLATGALNGISQPVESTKGEWGRGQHEVNYRYADVLTNADRHSVVKQCLKELSDQAGASVTFMAKWADDVAGSSCHLHLSLWAGEQNAFAAADGGPSNVFRWFLGGWLARVPEVMPLYAPTPNSYKRYQDGSWAPTRLGWALDNRTAAFRVVGQGPSLRIECRVPGADCNPYLALAAALASGLDGVARHVEPPDRVEGDLYAATDAPHVPTTLAEAVDRFEKSDFCRAAFGPEVVDHYTHFFRTEQAAYGRSVGEWERGRYFERI